MGIDCVIESHGRDHGGIADCLKLQMATVVSAFEFDDHELGISVESQQIDAARAALEATVFFGQDHGVGRDVLDAAFE